MKIYTILQRGSSLICENRIIVNKFNRKTIRLHFEFQPGLISGIKHIALFNPVVKQYKIVPLSDNNDYVIDESVSGYPGDWQILAIVASKAITGNDMTQADMLYISNMLPLKVQDNFLSENKQDEWPDIGLESLYLQVSKIKDTLDNYIASDYYRGKTGKSAFDLAVENGYKGTAGEWVSGLNKAVYYGDIFDSLGYIGDDVAGLQVDYQNNICKRISGADGLSAGTDFDKFIMYGGRKRCIVADDGSITAWYSDADYAEDGSIGQVMVYQPKFYYRVVPLKTDLQTDGLGYHLRKANYYVSEKPRTGFKLHPAFYDAAGNEVDYILYSAYEGSIYDTSAGAYLAADEQTADFKADKFCSIAGVKPASGKTQALTRPNVELLAANRGNGWHGDLIKAESANQLLMMIEFGTLNLQSVLAQGIVSVADNPNTDNNSLITGSTSGLGNSTGQAYGENGKASISYRGIENPWGNIWKLVYGINIWGDGKAEGGEPYICTDFNFDESKNSENYESAGFTLANVNGYISSFGYSPKYDWLFLPSETRGNSSSSIGDHAWTTSNLSGYNIVRLGGRWNYTYLSGGFCWDMINGVGGRYRDIGSRLVYVPDKDTASYIQAMSSWAKTIG